MEKFYSFITKNNLLVGDRVTVPKSLFDLIQHHAIYLGHLDGDYWFIENKEGFGVRLITAREFFEGVTKINEVVRFSPSKNYSREALVQHALRKLGKTYDLWNYNCETFANEVQLGVAESQQANFFKGTLIFVGILLLGRALLRH